MFNYASILCPDFPDPFPADPISLLQKLRKAEIPPIHHASGWISGREREERSQGDLQQQIPGTPPGPCPATPCRCLLGSYGSLPTHGAFGEF